MADYNYMDSGRDYDFTGFSSVVEQLSMSAETRLVMRNAINKALVGVPKHDREILALRFGLEDGQARSAKAIAMKMGMEEREVLRSVNLTIYYLRRPEVMKSIRDALGGAV